MLPQTSARTTFQIGQHRRGAGPDLAVAPVAIPAQVVQHTIQQIMVQGKCSNTDFSNVRMYESQEAVRLGAPAIARGSDIHFAPGAFQPSSEAGRKLIEDTLVTALCAMRPVPSPYPSSSSSSSATPSSASTPRSSKS